MAAPPPPKRAKIEESGDAPEPCALLALPDEILLVHIVHAIGSFARRTLFASRVCKELRRRARRMSVLAFTPAELRSGAKLRLQLALVLCARDPKSMQLTHRRRGARVEDLPREFSAIPCRLLVNVRVYDPRDAMYAARNVHVVIPGFEAGYDPNGLPQFVFVNPRKYMMHRICDAFREIAQLCEADDNASVGIAPADLYQTELVFRVPGAYLDDSPILREWAHRFFSAVTPCPTRARFAGVYTDSGALDKLASLIHYFGGGYQVKTWFSDVKEIGGVMRAEQWQRHSIALACMPQIERVMITGVQAPVAVDSTAVKQIFPCAKFSIQKVGLYTRTTPLVRALIEALDIEVGEIWQTQVYGPQVDEERALATVSPSAIQSYIGGANSFDRCTLPKVRWACVPALYDLRAVMQSMSVILRRVPKSVEVLTLLCYMSRLRSDPGRLSASQEDAAHLHGLRKLRIVALGKDDHECRPTDFTARPIPGVTCAVRTYRSAAWARLPDCLEYPDIEGLPPGMYDELSHESLHRDLVQGQSVITIYTIALDADSGKKGLYDPSLGDVVNTFLQQQQRHTPLL
jgi:hypothetical protein